MASMTRARSYHVLLTISCLLLMTEPSCSQTNTLLQGQELKGTDQLLSPSKIYSLGFSTFGDSNTCYLTIFYNKQDGRRQVWVANRNISMVDTCGMLTLDQYGNLMIFYDKGDPIFLYSAQAVRNASASAILLDTGNFVLQELNSDRSVKRMLWNSFDYPSNTLLPEMKLGYNYETGVGSSLISWRGSVPTLGAFTFGIDPNGANQLVILLRGDVYWTSGNWKNGRFNSSSVFSEHLGGAFSYISDGAEEAFFRFSEPDGERFRQLMIDGWGRVWCYEFDKVDLVVSCLSSTSVLSEGCLQQILPDCRRYTDRFLEKSGVMFSSGLKFDQSENFTIYDCQAKCLNNCSCIAFAFENGTDCEIWMRGTSLREVASKDGGRVLYILESEPEVNKWWVWLIVAIVGALVVPLTCSFCYIVLDNLMTKGKKKRKQKMMLFEIVGDALPSIRKYKKNHKATYELHIFSFESIAAASDNFSIVNKLGQGGYGAVYKGMLFDGQEIAIKRLSRSSGQGLAEFKNEATVIAKLQHINLVRLLGFCIQGEEKILIYEYMPNKSLDFFIFGTTYILLNQTWNELFSKHISNHSPTVTFHFEEDSMRRKSLNWAKRFSIIEGIAQGLVYLHKYSRMKVIHRDLKASNILLDQNMTPKISDFGMAKIFGLKEFEENTKRIVGTVGYIPPEYALKGIVSMKTDVFSFGVLLLEIVTGKKNRNHHHSDPPLNLIGLAWQLWKEGRGRELIDIAMSETYQPNEVLRCIHVGLLCVQDQARDRPTMIDVVSMLSNETIQLSSPKQPAFFIDAVAEQVEVPVNKLQSISTNYFTVSVVEAR